MTQDWQEEGFLTRSREDRALWQETHNKTKETDRVEALKDHLLVHNSLEGFDMDKDYTKDYPQEDAFRGFAEAVMTVESRFHEWWFIL